ncbi:MAG: hypothetical protein ABIP53_04865 [Candidatus Limnocylindrales bacterium]
MPDWLAFAPGVQFALLGIVDHTRFDRVIVGMVMIGFGSLWLIGRTGIPKSPKA